MVGFSNCIFSKWKLITGSISHSYKITIRFHTSVIFRFFASIIQRKPKRSGQMKISYFTYGQQLICINNKILKRTDVLFCFFFFLIFEYVSYSVIIIILVICTMFPGNCINTTVQPRNWIIERSIFISNWFFVIYIYPLYNSKSR